MSTFTVVSTVTHRSLMNKSKDDLARWVLHLLDCRDADERVRVQRVTDLLEANNNYQQIARDARATLMQRFDLVAHLHRQRAFSLETFGPGMRTAGVVDHIRKELREIEADPADVKEWIDVVILALDGAWRAGFEPSEIVAAIVAKQAKNEKRRWPDWRTADPDKAIEHDRSAEGTLPALTPDEPQEAEVAGVLAAFPISTADSAPKDGTIILAWWPLVQLDEDGHLTDLPVEGECKGAWVPTSWKGGGWDEPDWFDAIGDWFGDDYCYARDPTHWTHAPGDPTTRETGR